MKKKKETLQKSKEFASRPFGALKGVQGEPAAAEQLSVPAPLPEPAERAVDGELFLRAVAGVRRLHPATAAAGKGEKPIPRKADAVSDEERRLFLEALGTLQLDVSFRDELPGEDDPARPLPVNRLRQLKRGAIRIDFQLDLHGLTKDEAIKSLVLFITGASNR